jgi:hypothetical protein
VSGSQCSTRTESLHLQGKEALGCLILEDEGATFREDTGNHLPNNTASHPRRLKSSTSDETQNEEKYQNESGRN